MESLNPLGNYRSRMKLCYTTVLYDLQLLMGASRVTYQLKGLIKTLLKCYVKTFKFVCYPDCKSTYTVEPL